MQKIFNKTENIVPEMLRGIALANPQLQLHPNGNFFTYQRPNAQKVSVVGVGGSGHEPAYAGFVGKGMLDAAVLGEIFTAPTAQQIYEAIKAVSSPMGVLVLTQNFAQHVFQVNKAVEMAERDGILARAVVVSDDLAAKSSLYALGNRGSVGVLLLYKLVGAAAQKGLALDEVEELARQACQNLASINFALRSFVSPVTNLTTFQLGNGEVEYGVGLHGEPGAQRVHISTANELAVKLVNDLADFFGDASGQEWAVLVNGFGVTTQMELYVLAHSVDNVLAAKNIAAYKTYVGNYLCSANLAGASVSALRLNQQQKELLALPCESPTFQVQTFVPNRKRQKPTKPYNPTEPEYRAVEDNQFTLKNVIYIVDTMGHSIVKNELFFYELGFEEHMSALESSFRIIRRRWDALIAENTTIQDFLQACAKTIDEKEGGLLCDIWSFGLQCIAAKSAGKQKLGLEDVLSFFEKPCITPQAAKRYPFLKNRALIESITLIFASIKRSLAGNLQQGMPVLAALQRSVVYCRKILNISLFGADVRFRPTKHYQMLEDLVNYIVIVVLNDILDSMLL